MTRNDIINSIDTAINEARAQGFIGDSAQDYVDMELTGGFWEDELKALGSDNDRPAALDALGALMVERFEVLS